MRTIDGFGAFFGCPGSDTSVDLRERTVSRMEVVIVADGLMSGVAVYGPTAERADPRARVTSRLGPGAGR